MGADEGEAEQGQSGGARVHRGKRAVIARVDSASGSARALCVSDILSAIRATARHAAHSGCGARVRVYIPRPVHLFLARENRSRAGSVTVAKEWGRVVDAFGSVLGQ